MSLSALSVSFHYVLCQCACFLICRGGILLTRLTIDHGLGPYIATYCILNGIGMGVPYSVIFSVASSVG